MANHELITIQPANGVTVVSGPGLGNESYKDSQCPPSPTTVELLGSLATDSLKSSSE